MNQHLILYPSSLKSNAVLILISTKHVCDDACNFIVQHDGKITSTMNIQTMFSMGGITSIKLPSSAVSVMHHPGQLNLATALFRTKRNYLFRFFPDIMTLPKKNTRLLQKINFSINSLSFVFATQFRRLVNDLYIGGYTISLVTLIVSLCVFFSFR